MWPAAGAAGHPIVAQQARIIRIQRLIIAIQAVAVVVIDVTLAKIWDFGGLLVVFRLLRRIGHGRLRGGLLCRHPLIDPGLLRLPLRTVLLWHLAFEAGRRKNGVPLILLSPFLAA